MSKIEIVPSMSNREFVEKYAHPGRVGLAGGGGLIDLAIRKAERFVDPAQKVSLWSHAFVFEGTRADNRHWVIESDLEIHKKHIQLGVQENRIEKYHDGKFYPCIAVLDFGLTPAQTAALLCEALDMVANRVRYSIRELFGTLAGLRKPEMRAQNNPFAHEQSMFCSAFVLHLFRKIGMDLAPGLNEKHTTPEDISRTPVPHETFLLRREPVGLLVRDRIQEMRKTAKEKRAKRIEKVKTTLAARKLAAAARPR